MAPPVGVGSALADSSAMIPVVTPAEMRAIDAAADVDVDVLIGRAGAAVANAAREMLDGAEASRVVVLAGPGNNGADGRAAAVRLEARGVAATVLDARTLPSELPASDLVIDAAYGSGFRADSDRPWDPPDVGAAAVLAVDIPSGVDGLTGVAVPGALRADRTVTFQALKPGLLFADGPELAGGVEVVDIGLDTSLVSCHHVGRSDADVWWPRRARHAHKWHAAVKVLAGSTEMPGAAELCTAAALRGGAGLVSLSTPGCRPATRSEVVQRPIPACDFAPEALADLDRFGALVIGPGAGRDDAVAASLCDCIAGADVPIVIDGDAIWALGNATTAPSEVLRVRRAPTVLTPHAGEFATLMGDRPGDDRIAAARAAASTLGSTVLVKGPPTIVADGDSSLVLLVDHGDARLATAGSGDVLAGLLGAALSMGVDAPRAAAAAAWLHAQCAHELGEEGVVAGDLIDALPDAFGAMRRTETDR